MSNDIAIRVENVSKYYRLGVINNGTLFRDIQSWIARKRGKEDPHAKIGSKYDPTLEGFWALKDLNFEIKKGDRVGIIGHNGAGKSTLLKILSGITTPTEGNIKINGRISSLLEVGTGFHPEMTGRENIYLNGAILGMKKSEINKKIDEIIEFSGIKEHIDTPVKRYSSGMYVRLAFAVAAHLDSDILIADEVLAVGDAAFQKKALGKMNELSSGEGRTVLFVSHNMAQVKNLCNKGIVLEKGRVVKSGEIEEAISFYLSNSDGSEIGSSRVFKNDENKPFQLQRIQFFDENLQPASAVESQQVLHLQLTCLSRRPLAGLYGHFVVQNIYGQTIVSFDTKEQESSRIDNLSEGTHIFDLSFPKGLFAAGEYIFTCNFTSINYEGFNVDSPLECCRWKITDTLTERGINRGALTSVVPLMKEI
ncbi:MAG TPA: ABC transporter ATP-binding protein [Treponema sp.]|nr:ABC transporter ATP-binding protein [Treponema sp.]